MFSAPGPRRNFYSATVWARGGGTSRRPAISCPTVMRIRSGRFPPTPDRTSEWLDDHDPRGAEELPPAHLLFRSGHRASSCVCGPLGMVPRAHLPGASMGLRPEVRAALPALGPPAGVQGVALRTRQVHGARKKLSHDGAETQNAHHQGDIQQRLAHSSNFQLSAKSAS